MVVLAHRQTVQDKALKHNIEYSAFGGSCKGFSFISFTQLSNGLIGKYLEAPN